MPSRIGRDRPGEIVVEMGIGCTRYMAFQVRLMASLGLHQVEAAIDDCEERAVGREFLHRYE